MIQHVYIAGRITDNPNYLVEFEAAALSLRGDGFTVTNPCELDSPDEAAEALSERYGAKYKDLLARDLKIIEGDEIDAVVVLPGWTESRGAWREVDHAMMLGKPVLEYPNLNPAPVYEERARLRDRVFSTRCCKSVAEDKSTLPIDSQSRKRVPLTTGVLDYFPAALVAVAKVSLAGNDQHNPGEPLHHARGKSMDHADCIARHLLDRGAVDVDGHRHSAKAAWRALALLQEELEEAGDAPLARAAKAHDH